MKTLCPGVTADWRAWLARNCQSEKEIWLVVRHARADLAGVRYREAIEQALCYGWIDSNARKRDAGSFYLRFTPRRPRSAWSAVNRQRAVTMIELGLMTEHGQAAIEAAKASGAWQSAPPARRLPLASSGRPGQASRGALPGSRAGTSRSESPERRASGRVPN